MTGPTLANLDQASDLGDESPSVEHLGQEADRKVSQSLCPRDVAQFCHQ